MIDAPRHTPHNIRHEADTPRHEAVEANIDRLIEIGYESAIFNNSRQSLQEYQNEQTTYIATKQT